MSVVALRTHPVALPLARPFVTARRTTDRVEAVLVEAVDERGRSGWGEAVTTWRVTGESAAGVAAAVAGPLSDEVVGADPADVAAWAPRLARAVVGNASARAGVETAVLDLAARGAGLSLAELLAGAPPAASGAGPARLPAAVRTDMTLSAARDATELDALVARAAELTGTFGTLKVKVVDAPVTRDALVEVRRAVGAGVRLRVDANQAWDVPAAVRTVARWQDEGAAVELVEQPVAAGDLPGLAAVRAARLATVLADEAVRTVEDVDAVARAGAADAVNVKLTKSGGPVQALLVARRALDLGLGVVVGCMMESPVGVAAAAAVAAVLDAWQGEAVHDLDAGLWLARSGEPGAPGSGAVRYDGDLVVRHAGPGLGEVAVPSLREAAAPVAAREAAVPVAAREVGR